MRAPFELLPEDKYYLRFRRLQSGELHVKAMPWAVSFRAAEAPAAEGAAGRATAQGASVANAIYHQGAFDYVKGQYFKHPLLISGVPTAAREPGVNAAACVEVAHRELKRGFACNLARGPRPLDQVVLRLAGNARCGGMGRDDMHTGYLANDIAWVRRAWLPSSRAARQRERLDRRQQQLAADAAAAAAEAAAGDNLPAHSFASSADALAATLNAVTVGDSARDESHFDRQGRDKPEMAALACLLSRLQSDAAGAARAAVRRSMQLVVAYAEPTRQEQLWERLHQKGTMPQTVAGRLGQNPPNFPSYDAWFWGRGIVAVAAANAFLDRRTPGAPLGPSVSAAGAVLDAAGDHADDAQLRADVIRADARLAEGKLRHRDNLPLEPDDAQRVYKGAPHIVSALARQWASTDAAGQAELLARWFGTTAEAPLRFSGADLLRQLLAFAASKGFHKPLPAGRKPAAPNNSEDEPRV